MDPKVETDLAVVAATAAASVLLVPVVPAPVVHFGVMEEMAVLAVLVVQVVILVMAEDHRSVFMLGEVLEQLPIVFLIQELQVQVVLAKMVEQVLQEVQDQAELAMLDIVMVGLEVMAEAEVLAETEVVDRMVQLV